MNKTNEVRLEMADAHSKSSLRELTALQASRHLDVSQQRSVAAAIESNMELVKLIGALRHVISPVDLRGENKKEGGQE